PSCGPRGPLPTAPRRTVPPRSSWRARPRQPRRAGACVRSRRGTDRRCRDPRSLGSVRWFVLPCRPPVLRGLLAGSTHIDSNAPGGERIPAPGRSDPSPVQTSEGGGELPPEGTLRESSGSGICGQGGGEAHPVEDPRLGEGPVTPGLVAAA